MGMGLERWPGWTTPGLHSEAASRFKTTLPSRVEHTAHSPLGLSRLLDLMTVWGGLV